MLRAEVDIQGAGVDAFLALSAETLQVWAAAMAQLSSEDVADAELPAMSPSALRAYIESHDIDDVADDAERSASTDDDEDGGGVLGWLLRRAGSAAIPASVKAGLALLDIVMSVGQAALWGFLLFGGFKLIHRASTAKLKIDGSESDFTAEWALVPTWFSELASGSGGGVVVRGTRAYSEVQGYVGSELYKLLVGEEYTREDKGVVSTEYGVIDSLHSRPHSGLDLRIDGGTPLRSLGDGVVTRAWEGGSGGKSLQITLDNGIVIGMAHLQDNSFVPVGTRVRKGDVVAISGNTGAHTTGAHLHITFRRVSDMGSTVNPASIMPELGISVPMAQTSSFPADRQASGYSITLGSSLAKNAYNLTGLQAFGTQWKGKSGTVQASGGRVFERFTSPEWSLRATMGTLLNYQTRKDISRSGGAWTTIGDISRMYVGGGYTNRPAYEGDDIVQYARNISEFSGYGVDERIDVRRPEVIEKLTQAIARQESFSIVSDTAIKQVRAVAFNDFSSAVNKQDVSGLSSNLQKF